MKQESIITGLVAGCLFGLAAPLSKIIITEINSFQLAGLLYLGAAVTYIPFILKNRKVEFISLRKSDKKHFLAGVIVLGGILGPLLLMFGLKAADAMSVSIWLNLELVATAILGVFIFKDHLDRYAIAGIILTLAAGIIITSQESSGGFISFLFILLACICWGFDNHFSALIDGVSPQTITFVKGIFGGATNLTIGMFFNNWEIQLHYIPAALIIGVFSYGVSIVLYVRSAQNLGATRSQILFSSAPFWGILAAWIILGEPITMLVLASVLVLAAGIALTTYASHRHDHHHYRMMHLHTHSHEDEHHNHQHDEDVEQGTQHSHIHEHKDSSHEHKHFPDIHHRHDHKIL